MGRYKLTLSVDESVATRAREYAEQTGRHLRETTFPSSRVCVGA
jgi:hypothetical protein